METQTLTYLFVGASFALYIGIAFWSRANQLMIFTWLEKELIQ